MPARSHGSTQGDAGPSHFGIELFDRVFDGPFGRMRHQMPRRSLRCLGPCHTHTCTENSKRTSVDAGTRALGHRHTVRNLLTCHDQCCTRAPRFGNSWWHAAQVRCGRSTAPTRWRGCLGPCLHDGEGALDHAYTMARVPWTMPTRWRGWGWWWMMLVNDADRGGRGGNDDNDDDGGGCGDEDDTCEGFEGQLYRPLLYRP